MIGYIFIIIALVLYYLAYTSPRTDIILYIFSALFMLMGGVTGLVNGDLSLPVAVVSEVVGNTTTESLTLSDSTYYTWVLPLITIFLSLYLLINSIYLRND